MGASSIKNELSRLLAGRWQIPLAIVAAVTAGVGLYQLVPGPPDVDFDAVMADIAVLSAAGDNVAAADNIANLLEMEPPLPPRQQAALHDRMANLIHAMEQRSFEHNRENLKKLLANSQAAQELGLPVTGTMRLRDAQAHFWLGHNTQALEGLRAALAVESLDPDERRQAVQTLIDVLEMQPEGRLERRRMLEELLADEAQPPPYVWWALQRAIEDALDENDTLRARQLLDAHGDRLEASDLKGYLDYLWACIMVHEGRAREAEPLVRWIDDWLGAGRRSTYELDEFGHLPSLNRWLMGRIHLAEQRPQDALRAFQQAVEWQPNPLLRVAANVGRGLALGALDRHARAREVFEQAARDMSRLPGPRGPALTEFQTALLELFDRQRRAGDDDNALAYLRLAAELTPDTHRSEKLDLFERLGEAARAATTRAADPERQRELHELAAESFDRAAQLVDVDETRLAGLLWAAAEDYDRAGRLRALRRVLQQFIRGRANHPRIPQALLLLGQASEGLGNLGPALAAYEKLIEQFPELPQASEAKVNSARALLTRTEDQHARAETLLNTLLTEDAVSPDAPVFREALLTLCELLYRQGRYAEAISRLEDFHALYPDDPEALRSQFLLANAHRRSAEALRAEADDTIAGQAARAKSRERLQHAAELYGKLLDELENVRNPDDTLKLFTRLALFYRGDCLFELNDPESLQVALATYRNAAARYEGEPAALTAHVQIANIHMRLGDLTEAARALERARWLLRAVPPEAFDDRHGANRDDWDRFLKTVLSSDLFREAYAAAP